jgi:hypothetical protein
VRGYEFQLAELKKTLAATRNERAALAVRAEMADRLEKDLAAADLARRQAEERLAQLVEDGSAGAAAGVHERDVARLETALQDRGRRVTELERRLRQSVRAGRELVRTLDRVQSSTADPVSTDEVSTAVAVDGEPIAGDDPTQPVTTPPDAAARSSAVEGSSPGEPATVARLEADLELLAHRCATCQADLEAANWTIAGLRHQLPTPEDETTPETLKLEDALQAARAEIAELRAQLRSGDADE